MMCVTCECAVCVRCVRCVSVCVMCVTCECEVGTKNICTGNILNERFKLNSAMIVTQLKITLHLLLHAD